MSVPSRFPRCETSISRSRRFSGVSGISTFCTLSIQSSQAAGSAVMSSAHTCKLKLLSNVPISSDLSSAYCPRVAQRDEECKGDEPVTYLEEPLLSLIQIRRL